MNILKKELKIILKMVKYIAIIIGVFVVAFSVYVFLWFYYNATDTKNVEISGVVIDAETKKSLENISIVIESSRFTSDTGYSDYDSYLGRDTFYIKTDTNGSFLLNIKRSAFISIEINDESYENYHESKYASKKNKFDINLYKKR